MPQTISPPASTNDRTATGQRARQCAYCKGAFEAVKPLDRFCRPSCRKGFVDEQRAEIGKRGGLFER